MTDAICPYTGLRPFTEEESIYFKGRDEHIEQATHQLGKNKFLILTGASGDGKSSLVYAGIIPSAKAGFLKSRFSNWAIADFRPERKPLRNLCESLSRVLGIGVETVRAEIGHGFSALVDLYEASPLFADDPNASSDKKRKAANLIILADQYEEFFTNPENFHNGAPSQEAALVTNVLLETARIALERDLPIYVIITMRSDFIGQCAAFRGLPEYIGFSQFFVPRLNRVQLKEVIEEPAVLSGNQIAPRLTERLIHDMAEGNDQLPILQHALNQIWENADGQEMDLIHYAMVGGMKGSDLPPSDAARFGQWFESLPPKIKGCYDQPGLENVLNTHANMLYTLADDYLKKEYGEQVSEADALAILETTFKCLTKIDSSRAVRNRMTLAEITAILNRPHLGYQQVGTVLNIFREPGNTLVRPFIEEVPVLQPETVLDITHESLIRNWERLETWAAEEYQNLSTYLDFRQQVHRWIEHNRSSNFLLYIGPLTFFENWFDKAKPNEAWLSRYLKSETNPLETARKEIEDAKTFLSRSARSLMVTRAVMRYGPRRIAAVVGLAIVLVLSSFGIRNYMRTQNAAVLSQIKEETFELINRKKASRSMAGALVTEQIDNGRISLKEVAARSVDPLRGAEVLSAVAVNLILHSNVKPSAPILEALILGDSLFSTYNFEGADNSKKSISLQKANEFAASLAVVQSRDPSETINLLVKKHAQRTGMWASTILTTQPSGFTNVPVVYRAVNNTLTYHGMDEAKIRELTAILSPYENVSRTPWLLNNFQKDKQLEVGWFNYGLNYNGLYQLLANLYSAQGKPQMALQCIDTLLKYNQNYYEKKYMYLLDNATNVAGFLYQYGHQEKVLPFIDAYVAHSGENRNEFFDLLIGRSQTDDRLMRVNDFLDGDYKEAAHNLEVGSIEQIAFFADLWKQDIEARIRDVNERNYLLAMCHKNSGCRIHRKLKEAGTDSAARVAARYFDKAVVHFNQVDAGYLSGAVPNYIAFSQNYPRREAFYYPDFAPQIEYGDPRRSNGGVSSDGFLEYALDKGIIASWMEYPEGPGAIEDWMYGYNIMMEFPSDFMYQGTKHLGRLAKVMEGVKEQGRNLTLLHLNVIKDAGEKNDTTMIRMAAAHLKPDEFVNVMSFSVPGRIFFYTTIFRTTAIAALHVAKWQGFDGAWAMIAGFKKPENKAMIAANIATELLKEDPNSPLALRMLDSAKAQVPRVSTTAAPVFRAHILEALAYQGGAPGIEEGLTLTKNVGDKVRVMNFVGWVLAYRGQLYESYDRLPLETNDQNRANYYALMNYALQEAGLDKVQKNWEGYVLTYPIGIKPFYYSDENQ